MMVAMAATMVEAETRAVVERAAGTLAGLDNTAELVAAQVVAVPAAAASLQDSQGGTRSIRSST